MNARKILVTGTTGGLGKAIVEALLQRVPARQIVATARDLGKLEDVATRGVELRRADYFDYTSLVSSFRGVDTVFLVSAVAFTDRTLQHANAISAALEAGVRRFFYTAIERNGVDGAVISSVTQSDIETEYLLKTSGLEYTVLKHPLYVESIPVFLGAKVFEAGVRTPSGAGRIPLTSRDDLAQGAAALLARDAFSPREISFNNGSSHSFSELAQALSKIAGRDVPFIEISKEEYVAERVADGIPPPVAEFFSEWLRAVAHGAFDAPDATLQEVLGRAPLSLEAGLAKAFAPAN